MSDYSSYDESDERFHEDESEYLRLQYHELAELAGSLAHEIKNPLSVIRMNIDLVVEDLEAVESPDAKRALRKVDVVQKQCTRLEGLLNDFLRFTRLSRLQLVPGSLNQQIEQVLDFFEADAAERHVEVLRYLNPELPIIRMDKATIQAALVNLVKNALEAMPDGGQLVARTRLTRKGVALDLIDSGKGMEDETLLNMFQAFYTTKDGGSGLGLPMAKKIIEAHGGVINVQSTAGRGTQFSLEFPTPPRLRPNLDSLESSTVEPDCITDD